MVYTGKPADYIKGAEDVIHFNTTTYEPDLDLAQAQALVAIAKTLENISAQLDNLYQLIRKDSEEIKEAMSFSNG